jgi:hypothetical protein
MKYHVVFLFVLLCLLISCQKQEPVSSESKPKTVQKTQTSVAVKSTLERSCFLKHNFGDVDANQKLTCSLELKNDTEIVKLWSELEWQIFEALARLKQSQRSDGSFDPPDLTSGSQTPENIDVYYTGHSLEWLMFLDNDYSCDDWIVRGINRLCESVKIVHIQVFRNLDAVGNEVSHFDFNGLCHAVSALNLWKNSLESKRQVDKATKRR